MKKRIAIGLISILIVWLCYGFIPRVLANPSYEDFTAYTEVDIVDDRIQKTSTHVDHNAWRDESTYLYDDKGAGHFTDFEHLVDVRSDFATAGGIGVVWMLANDVGDRQTLYNAGETLIYVLLYNSKMYLWEDYSSNQYFDDYSVSADTWYYLIIEKDGTSLTCEIYSDSDRTNLLDTLSLTLQADHSFRYIYACNSANTGNALNCNTDIENLDLQEGEVDNPPFYSDVGDDGVTQVGESVTVSCYWEDDLELNWTIVSHNSTGSYENFTVSCSGNASWSNKTFQLSYTTGDKVGYLFYGQDNSSQWNSTGITYITTTPLYITFNLNNSTMGAFYVDLVETSNETVNSYDYDETVNLMGTPANSSFIFEKFSWSGGQTFTNPYDYTTSGNNTVWCYFDEAGEGGEGDITYLVLAVLLGVVAVFVLIYALSKR